jgi:hypothetical protein
MTLTAISQLGRLIATQIPSSEAEDPRGPPSQAGWPGPVSERTCSRLRTPRRTIGEELRPSYTKS